MSVKKEKKERDGIEIGVGTKYRISYLLAVTIGHARSAKLGSKNAVNELGPYSLQRKACVVLSNKTKHLTLRR